MKSRLLERFRRPGAHVRRRGCIGMNSKWRERRGAIGPGLTRPFVSGCGRVRRRRPLRCVNDEPQPHVDVAFGFLIVNPPPVTVSTKSTSAPFR